MALIRTRVFFVMRGIVSGFLERTKHHAAGPVQQIDRAKDDPRRGGDRVSRAEVAVYRTACDGRGPETNVPSSTRNSLTKPLRPGRATLEKTKKMAEKSQGRARPDNAADLVHVARVIAFIDHADHEE